MAVRVGKDWLRKGSVPPGELKWMRWPVGSKYSMWHILGVPRLDRHGDVSVCTSCGVFPRLLGMVRTVDSPPAGEKRCENCLYPGHQRGKR